MKLRTYQAVRSVISPIFPNHTHAIQFRLLAKYHYSSIISPSQLQRRQVHTNPADDPEWTSVIDNPPVLVRFRQKHGPGLIVLRETSFVHCMLNNAVN